MDEAKNMKVTILVPGRFHAFYLAQQLLKKGYLGKLITSYPGFEVKKYGIPLERVDSIIIKEVLFRIWQKLPRAMKEKYHPQFFFSDLFDKLASRKIEQANIFIGWANSSLHSLRKAKQKGAIAILERGSSHILYQQQILREEYEKFGLKFNEIHPKSIEKELKEYQEADYISIPSSFVRRTFIEKGIPENKLIQVPYGVNLSEFRRVSKKDDVFRVVYAGSMGLRKGVHYLLKAFSELKLPKAELLLVGGMDEKMKPFFERHKGNYKWVGFQPQKELYKYYSQGSVFVMPSIEEGMAMVQLQAMACGLPLICTTNTGGEDLIENGKQGFVVPIRDVEALKEKILFLYENPEICKEMGRSAKERVEKEFTWDHYGERIINEYKRVLENR
jgi:glycosyltransferase involved in cell wall biosynthesis